MRASQVGCKLYGPVDAATATVPIFLEASSLAVANSTGKYVILSFAMCITIVSL